MTLIRREAQFGWVGLACYLMDERHWGDGPTPDPRLGGESADSVDAVDEGWNEDTEDPGDDIGTI